MALQAYINFNGNCREAVEFYAKVFRADAPKYMLYGDVPPDPIMGFDDKDKNLIMHTSLLIAGDTVMFSDTPPGMPFASGNNISLTIITKDAEEIRRLYHELSQGGEVGMALQETFWSNLYGMVTDKFGTNWQFSHDSGKVY